MIEARQISNIDMCYFIEDDAIMAYYTVRAGNTGLAPRDFMLCQLRQVRFGTPRRFCDELRAPLRLGQSVIMDGDVVDRVVETRADEQEYYRTYRRLMRNDYSNWTS